MPEPDSPQNVQGNGSDHGSNRRTTRRRFVGSTVAGGTVASLGGCLSSFSGINGGSGGTTGGTASNGSTTNLNVAAVEGSGRLFQRLVNNYVESHIDGVKVNVTLVPFSNLHVKINSVLGTQGDAYDLIFLPDIWFPQYAGDLEPVKKWVPGEYPSDKIMDSCITDGTWPAPDWPTVPSTPEGMKERLRAQVVVGNTQLFAYNEKHYEKVGAQTPPETWDDVLSAGRKIDQQIDEVNGYVIRGKRGNPIMTNFYPVGRAKAGRMFNDAWRFAWNGRAGIDALESYARDLKSISPNGVTAFNSDEVLSRLGSGSAAQANVWPAAASLLLDPDKSNAAENLKFTVNPKGAAQRAPQIGTWMAGINKYTNKERKEAAGKVIGSFISRDAQERYIELGGVPFRSDTLQNNMDAKPWFKALYNSLQKATFRPRTPLWNQIGISFGKYLNKCLAGQATPKETMQKAQHTFENTMDRARYYDN